MRIAVHTSHYPYSENRPGYVSGGGERVAKSVSKELANRGHEVSVYTAAAGASERYYEDGVEVVRFRSLARIGETSVSPRQFLPIPDAADLIHVHNTTPPGVISGYLHSTRVGAPMVLTHHGNDRYVPNGSPIKRVLDYVYAEIMLDYILQRSAGISLPSETYLTESERLQRVQNKIRTIPNGIDISRYDRPETETQAEATFGLCSDDDVVVFLGDMIPKKGPDLLVDAANHLENVTVIVAGSGPLVKQCRDVATDSVILPGYISEETKIALLNRADLFCLPSRTHTEVFPLVLLEAYASRTPVVASDLGTFEGLIDETTGRYFPRDESTALAETISTLLSDKEKRTELSAGARKAAEDYRWPEIAKRYESMFEQVLQESK